MWHAIYFITYIFIKIFIEINFNKFTCDTFRDFASSK